MLATRRLRWHLALALASASACGSQTAPLDSSATASRRSPSYILPKNELRKTPMPLRFLPDMECLSTELGEYWTKPCSVVDEVWLCVEDDREWRGALTPAGADQGSSMSSGRSGSRCREEEGSIVVIPKFVTVVPHTVAHTNKAKRPGLARAVIRRESTAWVVG